MAQIDFYIQFWIAAGAEKRDFIYLSYNNYNGSLKISNRNNENLVINNKVVSNWMGSDLNWQKLKLFRGYKKSIIRK